MISPVFYLLVFHFFSVLLELALLLAMPCNMEIAKKFVVVGLDASVSAELFSTLAYFLVHAEFPPRIM